MIDDFNEKLTELELRLLRECAGQEPKTKWGAAVSVGLEFLQDSGLITRAGFVTPAGRKVLEREKERSNG